MFISGVIEKRSRDRQIERAEAINYGEERTRKRENETLRVQYREREERRSGRRFRARASRVASADYDT